MLLDDFLTEREAYPSSFIFLLAVETFECLKHLLEMIWRNPNPVVADMDPPPVWGRECANFYFGGGFPSEFDCVSYEILEELGDELRVDSNRGQIY